MSNSSEWAAINSCRPDFPALQGEVYPDPAPIPVSDDRTGDPDVFARNTE